MEFSLRADRDGIEHSGVGLVANSYTISTVLV